jgi:hypothetical protein
MKIAIQHEHLNVDPEGNVVGHSAGDTLVRRLLRVFPHAQLIGPKTHRYPDFDVIPLEMVDGENTVVINMNVIDSVHSWRALKATCENPKIMNFVWWDTSRYTADVELAEMALACALFPTFANSERTAQGLKDALQRWVVSQLAERAKISWVNLGIRLEHAMPRHEPEKPVVLYPAIYVSKRKRPDLFTEVVTKVAKKTPIQVEARLVESHLITEPAMKLATNHWASVGPLKASRSDYWEALSHTTAFLATAEEESYGLEYIEALVAGAIGVFPDKEWARAILPEKYPYFYKTVAEAEALLLKAVTETELCRQELDYASGGDFSKWLKDQHDDDNFETSIVSHVEQWFGPIEGAVKPTK